MTTDLALLTNTTITAECMVGWARVVIEKTPTGLRATLSANAGGNKLGPVIKELKGKVGESVGAVAKAGLVVPLLRQGFDHLAVKTADLPDGLPIEIVVGEKGQTYKGQFHLPMNLNAFASFMEIVAMVKSVNKMAANR